MYYLRSISNAAFATNYSPMYANRMAQENALFMATQDLVTDSHPEHPELFVEDGFVHNYDVQSSPLGAVERAVAVDDAKVTLESLGRVPGVLSGVKTLTQMMVRGAALPVQTVLMLNVIHGLPVRDAWQQVKTNPYAGVRAIVTSVALESSAILLTCELYKKALVEHHCFENEKTSERVASLMAAITGTCLSAPLMTLGTRQQLSGGQSNTKLLKGNLRDTLKEVTLLYRGVTPAAMKNVCSWTIGLSIGGYFDENLRDLLGDTVTTQVTAKTAGWMVGSFIGAPFFNLQTEMRRDPAMKSMVEVLRKKQIIFNPAMYTAEDFTVNSLFVRLVMGMPLEQSVITSKEGVKCRLFAAVKNAPKLWRGALKAMPVTALAGTAVSVGFLAADKLFAPSDKQ